MFSHYKTRHSLFLCLTVANGKTHEYGYKQPELVESPLLTLIQLKQRMTSGLEWENIMPKVEELYCGLLSGP